ncbi:MAG: NFACT RNA binding domain-containing protein [Holophagales bacterium]|nr:NFACT RNA binding domain-containing protein [Holophagales bacterium]
MEAPLLFALARARLNMGEGAVQSVWASPRALALGWAPDRLAGLGPGMAWIFLISPAQELWLLHEKQEAYLALKSESKTDLSRLWSQELKGARLCDVMGDPRERWIAFEFRRRAITGRIEGMQLSFQAIPGRGGLRLDGLDLNQARAGMGTPFPSKQPDCETDTPPLQRWREKWGGRFDDAINGRIADVLPGEGMLFQRHAEWSTQRADKLLLQPKIQAASRKVIKERQRLDRYGKALAEDRERHLGAIGLREPAGKLQAELWRLKGACGSVKLLDGTIIELPPGMSIEVTVQKWFTQAKKAERGLLRVDALERERIRQIMELERACGSDAQTLNDAPKKSQVQAKQTGSSSRGKKKMEQEKDHKRSDGKGRAYRSQMVEGFEVLIGRGDADNDILTFKVASPLDFWLHVASVPGSHVVIRNPDRISEPPRNVLERAAELAAFYSKAREGGKVEVHWCRAADVNKPRGFEPGKVFLKNYKSLKVYPKQ